MSKVSVLMAVYNGERFVEETIISVLNQTFGDFEFIIIDDGSTDSTKEIISKFDDKRIKYYYFENAGLAKALNRGLKISSGKYIARIDADDICYPERFEIQYKFMEENPEYVVCGGFADLITEDNEFICTYLVPNLDEDIKKQMQIKNCFLHSSTFYIREKAIEIGGYYEPIKQYFEDYLFFKKLLFNGKGYNIPHSIIKYRITAGSINSSLKNRRFKKNVKKIIDRGYASVQEVTQLKKTIKNYSGKRKTSQYYLLLSRLFIRHQNNLLKAINNIGIAFKAEPLNPYVPITLCYCFIWYSFNSLRKFNCCESTK